MDESGAAKARLLIAEHDDTARGVIELVLRKQSYDPIAVSDAE